MRILAGKQHHTPGNINASNEYEIDGPGIQVKHEKKFKNVIFASMGACLLNIKIRNKKYEQFVM